jgi:peptidoglycan/LPS O-acetylase OafA/YrhL
MHLETQSSDRNTILDFLRFTGVSLTLFRHLIIPPDEGLAISVIRMIQRGGWIGVDLFFVLSGFLVSGLIFKEIIKHKSFSPKNFLIRRGLKIYPSYYIFLFCCAALFFVRPNYRVTTPGFFSEFFFISNYVGGDHNWLWSIAIEEHFYFFLSFVLFILATYNALSFRSICAMYLFFLGTGFLFRLYNYNHFDQFDWFRDITKSHFRFDALFFGVFLAYLFHFHREFLNIVLRAKRFLFFVCIVFISTNFMWEIEKYRWVGLFSLSLNSIFFGLLMIIMVDSKSLGENGIVKSLAYIGKYSYSIYLFHGTIHLFFMGRFPFWAYVVGYISAALVFGILFSKVVEYPFLSLRDKYFPSRQ